MINAPAAGTTWKVGDVINFSGSATDAQDGTLPASALSWKLILQHCPSNCHAHIVADVRQESAAVRSPHPTTNIRPTSSCKLTATDSGGLTNTKTVRLDPKTVTLTFQTTPGGLLLAVDGSTTKSAFNRVAIVGSTPHG